MRSFSDKGLKVTSFRHIQLILRHKFNKTTDREIKKQRAALRHTKMRSFSAKNLKVILSKERISHLQEKHRV